MKVRNIIFLIGDGMGIAQVHAAMTENGGQLQLERCRHIGFQKTSSKSHYVTDSGASATAMATGEKTTNHFIGMSPDSSNLASITELAKAKGLAVGIVSTSAITHATPASFMSHCDSRYKYEEIAEDISESNVDVIIGGGVSHFKNRKDGQDLIAKMKNSGYHFSEGIPTKVDFKQNKFLVLAADEHMPKVIDGRGEYLLDATNFTLNQLSSISDKGFFAMIESSQIDWGGHNNDLKYVTSETLDFDKTIGAALNFADKNPGTLVIITGDHETGGLSILDGNYADKNVVGHFSTKGHSGIMVPVYAYGAGADIFTGFYENTAIFEKIIFLLKL